MFGFPISKLPSFSNVNRMTIEFWRFERWLMHSEISIRSGFCTEIFKCFLSDRNRHQTDNRWHGLEMLTNRWGLLFSAFLNKLVQVQRSGNEYYLCWSFSWYLFTKLKFLNSWFRWKVFGRKSLMWTVLKWLYAQVKVSMRFCAIFCLE